MKRRDFVKLTAMAGAATLVPWRRAYAAFPVQTPSIQKFIQPLRGLGGPGIPLATPVSSYAAGAGFPAVDYYEMALRQYFDQLHPALPPTKLWGYGNKADATFRHLGGVIVANRETATRIRFFNELPNLHPLPLDNTVPGVDAATMAMHNRAAVHLHGGFVPWTSDGGPHHWFGPGNTGATAPAQTGLSYQQWLPDPNGGALTNDYWYPNLQSARLMWYHDHAVGITRLNAYAGLASAYVLRDPAETFLVGTGAVPPGEIPLVFQDKVFNGIDGSLWYPSIYDLQFWILNPAPAVPPLPVPNPSLVAEFWGDTMLVNGTVLPFVEVEPKRYRLRLLNACNTRFLSLQLVYSAGKKFPDSTEPNLNAAGPLMQQIANEAGFLDPAAAPQGIPIGTAKNPLVLAPAERADVIVDFSKVKPGNFIILYNDAPVPFPGGTPLGDFYPGNNKLVTPPLPGFAPATRTVLQFRVVPLVSADAPPPPAWSLPALDPAPLVPFVPGAVPAIPPGAFVRDLTLNETFDKYGRLEQRIGGVILAPQSDGNLGFGLAYDDTATEQVSAGAIEVWRIFNLTADAHPIHFHLANVQVLQRQPFNVRQFNGVPSWTASPRGPDPNEMGWKETVKMYPGECTTVIMKFDLPPDPVIPVTTLVNGVASTTSTAAPPPLSPRTGGREYVYHCHILEHEEHDMMRPLVVL